ncbi:MAG TPA: hypothetical protein VNZ56_08260 [Verrucomicrobiae bacterium]|nr:hypothetical protein [Verrucomicrobiae bacterium]
MGRPADAQRQPRRSPHGSLNIPCENCHTNTSWSPIRAIPEFNHDTTRYPLRGMHEKVACTGCHVKSVFTDVGRNCANCHADIHRGQFGANCAQCHTVLGWQVSVQSIQQHFNRFPLLGAHAVAQCEECHTNAAAGNYLGLSTACSSCHLSDWQQTNDPPHPAASTAFAAANCTNCHSFDNWLNAKFDHSSTGFLLTNGHANVACSLCHINNNYNLTIAPTDCGNSQCHLTNWQQTNNPPHPAAGAAFAAANCSTCHNTVNWTTATFDHSTTGFLLTQGHANVACSQCHINNNYSLTIAPTDCGNAQCHLTTWQQTNNPVHSTSGSAFAAANCATCHTTAGWTAAAFDHSVTGFTLVGTHVSPTPTPCAACHINNNYSLNSADCYGCHAAAFQSTTTIGGNVPNHVTAGFPTTASACASCHPITTWSAGNFNHSATGFPLTNGHANVACALCHINNNYSLAIAATGCGNSQCHLTDWQQTNNPVHSTSGTAFAAANCSNCHTTAGWDAASFDHSVTGFTLVGTHMSPTPTACSACHVNNNYTLNSSDCYGCHSAVYQGTATIGGSVPNHVAAGFPTTAAQCASCHPITTWSAGIFNHSTTGFPLTNSHAAVACNLCHINSNYSLQIAPTSCGNSQCHLTDWNNTNAPPHSAAGAAFAAANCATCHTTVSWTTATFDHSTTGFALTGMHVSPSPTPCAACHVNNNYSLNSTACYGCHTADWQSTTTLGGSVPNHIAASFPTDCSICHSTTNWATSTFNHSTTSFPLTGAHTAVACALCHVNGNYSGTLPTDCYSCHTTDWQSTTTLGGSVPNHITSGYPTTCASCHTTTSWAGATFNHNSTGFPLTGAHVTVACNLCHTTTNPPPTDCYSCHTADWNSTATLGGSVPNHVAASQVAGTPFVTSGCSTCHTTTNWLGATFTHSWWPTNHGNAGGICGTCHTNSSDYSAFVCSNGTCHPQAQINQTHKGVSSYVYSTGATCYSCHKNGGG